MGLHARAARGSKSSRTPIAQRNLESRPFAPPAKPNPERTMADVQAQLDHAQRFGHRMANIDFSPRRSSRLHFMVVLANDPLFAADIERSENSFDVVVELWRAAGVNRLG